MTVETTDRVVIYRGNGIATEFPFNFIIPEGTLYVALQNYVTNVVAPPLADGSYGVIGLDSPEGGTITYPLMGDPLEDDFNIVIYREVPYTQDLEISNYGGFQPATVEQQLDLIVMQIQQLAEEQSRSVTAEFGVSPQELVDIIFESVETSGANAAAAQAAADAAEEAAATLTYASDPEAATGTVTDRLMSPARVRTQVGESTFTLEEMANPETLAAIINRTGLTPQMRGAEDGQSDHKAYMQQAWDDVAAAGGGRVWLTNDFDWELQSGGLELHSGADKLDQHVALCGVGDATRIKYAPSTGSPFNIGDGTNPVSDVSLCDLYLISTATKTAGFDFNLRWASNVKLSRIKTDGSFAGINQEYVNGVDVDLVEVNSLVAGGSAMRVFAEPSIGRCDRISVKRFTGQGRNKGMNGLAIYGAVNVFNCDEMYMLGVDRGLDVNSNDDVGENPSLIVPFQLYLKNFEVDRAINNAVVLNMGTDITFERPDIANTSGAGAEPPGAAQGGADGTVFAANAGVTMLRVLNGRLGNGRQGAMDIRAQDVIIENMRFHDVSKQTGSPGPWYIIYCGTEARRVIIHKNRFDGFSRATYCVQAEDAVTGDIRFNNYTRMVNGFSAYGGSGIDFANNDSF